MINMLILAAGDPGFDTGDGGYPLCLAEIDGQPLIERIMADCARLPQARFVVALRDEDTARFHLDNVVRLIAPDAAIVRAGRTRGAACTALLAARHLDSDIPLLVVNANQIVDIDLGEAVAGFAAAGLDAGVVTFRSVHPRYSYVRIDAAGLVVEAAEKNPISQNAAAGIFWFARGRDLVAAIKAMIRRDAHVDGTYFICPALNEMVLDQARIGIRTIDPARYHPLKSERQLQHFEHATEPRRPR
jgi:dTDP-glucose pyrophosphorylase